MAPPSVRSWLRFMVAVFLLLPTRLAFAGDLDRVGKEVRGDKPVRAKRPHHEEHSPRHDHAEEHSPRHDHAADASEAAVESLLGYIVLFPWLIPHALAEAGRPPNAAYGVRFAAYPYANGAEGFLLDPIPYPITDDAIESERDPAPAAGHIVAGQIAAEVGVSGGTRRDGARVRVQFPERLELDSDWSRYQEVDRSDVDVTFWGREHLSFRFAESRSIQFRSGVGPQHLFDAKGWVHGLDFTWGFEAFPTRPLVFAFEASLGALGKALTAGLSARIGALLGPLEIGAGWHQRWVGSVALGSPFATAQIWF